MSTEAMISALSDLLGAEPDDMIAAYLFGSFARGEQREDSDVDLGVLYLTPPAKTIDGAPARLEGRLEAALGRPVQVICLNTAPADLIHRVMRDGLLLLEADPARRVRFEVAARNEYFDLLPFLQRYRQARAS